jgi:hypothetical protein
MAYEDSAHFTDQLDHRTDDRKYTLQQNNCGAKKLLVFSNKDGITLIGT